MTLKEFIRPGLRIVARLDGKEMNTDFTPLTVDRSIGGGVGDRATVRVNRRRHFVDGVLWPPIGILTIDVVDDNDEPERIFWGGGSGTSLDLAVEGQVLEFRVGRFHFGEPIIGMYERWKLTKKEDEGAKSSLKKKKPENEDEITLLPVAPLFNPIIDGEVRGNMRPDRTGPGDCALWVDWESMRSSKARELQKIKYYGQGAFERNKDQFLWTLPRALHTLCWCLNPKQKWIKNPTIGEIEEVVEKDTGLLRHRGLRIGMHLNEALDALLGPLGYTWSLDLNADKKKPKIHFHKRGSGKEKVLYLQKPEAKPAPSKLNVGDGQISMGSHATTNQVIVMGDHKKWEVTIPLVPAWRDTFDGLTDENTAKDGRGGYLPEDEGTKTYLNTEYYRDVHRKFVANEAGDYNGFRPRIRKAADLTNIFGHGVVPRRRRAHPCLTKLSTGEPIGDNGYVIEVLFPTTRYWQPLDTLQDHGEVVILENEIGFLFDGLLVPPEVQAHNDGIRFRMTCTIVDDERLVHVEGPYPKSAQPETVTTVLDEADRFHYRQIDESSIHYEQVKNGALIADVVDDTEEIEKFAERQVEAWDMLDVDGGCTVIALDGEQYHLGDVLTQILGRGIKLNATPGSTNKRNPQIATISYDLVNHARKLGFSTMRDEVRG